MGHKLNHRYYRQWWCYCTFKKSWPNLYRNLLYRFGQDFLDIQYDGCRVSDEAAYWVEYLIFSQISDWIPKILKSLFNITNIPVRYRYSHDKYHKFQFNIYIWDMAQLDTPSSPNITKEYFTPIWLGLNIWISDIKNSSSMFKVWRVWNNA